jgi:hypothetical protein
VRSGPARHVAALELTSAGRCGHVTAPELTFQEGRAQSQGTRDSAGAHLSMKARSRGHVVASEPTSAGRCDSKLQLI